MKNGVKNIQTAHYNGACMVYVLKDLKNQEIWTQKLCTLQMFTGVYRVSTGKSECGDFKFMGIECIPAIPVILKSPHSNFHCNICREFDLHGFYGDSLHQ